MIDFLPDELRFRLQKRPEDAHKNDFGHLVIVAGSRGMAGAAVLAANGAMRSGAGLVTVVCPESVLTIVQTLAPCAMALPLPEWDGAISSDAVPVLLDFLKGKSAIAVGCGLSRRASPEVLEALLKTDLPAVLDADALNIMAANPRLLTLLRPRHVMTPHPGEAGRLLRRDVTTSEADARALAGLGCVALLKGAATIVCGRETHRIACGTVGLAKGGSGDVLTGVLGSLLAQGYEPEEAAVLAAAIHGLAGRIAAERVGTVGMLPTDTVNCLPEVFRRCV